MGAIHVPAPPPSKSVTTWRTARALRSQSYECRLTSGLLDFQRVGVSAVFENQLLQVEERLLVAGLREEREKRKRQATGSRNVARCTLSHCLSQ